MMSRVVVFEPMAPTGQGGGVPSLVRDITVCGMEDTMECYKVCFCIICVYELTIPKTKCLGA